MQSPAPTATDKEQRPALLLAVYTWDMLLALLALIGALTAFGGSAAVGQRTVSVGVGEQVLAGFSSASRGALLIIIATLLTRRQRWVRRMQIGAYLVAIGLGGLSVLLEAVLPGHGLAAAYILSALLVLLIDVVAIVVLTGQKIVAWYIVDAPTPKYISGTLAFWLGSGLVLIALQAVR